MPRPSPQGWVYGVPRNRTRPAIPRNPAVAVAVAVAAEVAGPRPALPPVQGAGRSPAEHPTLLERGRRLERERLARHRVSELQLPRMQAHALRGLCAIQHVADDRMTQAGHVQAQLMAAAGDRFQFNARALRLGVTRQYPPS